MYLNNSFLRLPVGNRMTASLRERLERAVILSANWQEVQGMGVELARTKARSAWGIASILALTIAASGCRARRQDSGVSEATIGAGRVDTPEASAKKVASAGVAIISECARVSFANVKEGLIVAEPGLHEDLFDLRDRASYRAVPFGLNETLRLEELLQRESATPEHPDYSAEQAKCIDQFVAHLRALTEPLVEADAEQKQLDLSAFDKASREAEQEAEQQSEQEQKAMEHSGSTNRN